VNEGKITTSPAAGVRKITPEKDRDRILNLSEVAAFVPACESIGYPFGMVALLLLLTGQRLREVANMEWSEVDLDARLWTLPAERAKNGRENHIHLSAPALAILKAIAAERDKIEVRRNAMLVFTHVGVPISGYDDLKGRLDREMAREMGRQVEPFTLHDLRRSAASIMAACKVPPHIVERVLNHTGGTISGVAAIYNKHTYREETAEALDKLAEYVTTATAPEVIIMRGQARALTHA
jgi:integrase